MERRKKYTHSLPGSVTLEAALVLPLFLYFFLNLFTLFDILRVQSLVEAALHQAGREIGQHAFTLHYAEEVIARADGAAVTDGAGLSLVSAAYAKQRVRDYLEETGANLQCVKGGLDGFSMLRSDPLSQDGVLDLVISYEVQPLVRILPFSSFSMEARYFGHVWTGYRIPGTAQEEQEEEEEETVYITRTGTVYHTRADCTYLRPKVRAVGETVPEGLRNASGGKYYPCESCGMGASSTCYVTDYGTRFHTSASCNKIERDVRAVKRSEVRGRACCSKCGT